MARPSVRDKIVCAALERFHTLGFSACSVQDIVDTAGVPKGSFYNYFKAKELLALEVLGIYGHDCKREILSDKRLPPLERLRGHFEFMAAHFAESGYKKGCLIANLAAEMSDNTPLLRQAIDQSLEKWTASVAATLREGQNDGSIVATLDAEKMARFIINSWEGTVVRMKIARCRQPLEDFFAVAFVLLTRSAP
ncbi:TetR/AcrR family transcriptional regulator [Martelella alba]|uniref:TetR family transcriptional regulator n=1 Tax=Martelella alba TaxID=2590451 RepID=A0ABY2SPJ4_9HYPH|nr:TetR/AcrR family transcriptional regulator [Martelella alba]TKI08024.1 TetR family transcriptional regulator [Martelella alba]